MTDHDRSTLRDLDQARLDPGSVFGSPEQVLRRADLTTALNVDILRRWEYDAAEIAVAEEEGMTGSENDLLRRIPARVGSAYIGPTSHPLAPPNSTSLSDDCTAQRLADLSRDRTRSHRPKKGGGMDTTTRKILIALGVLLIVALALSSTMGGMMGPGMMGPGVTGRWGGWMWGAGMWLGGLAMLIFWGALIVGAVLVVRLLGGLPWGDERTPPTSPLDILKRRYASGEITREQYEQMRKDLAP